MGDNLNILSLKSELRSQASQKVVLNTCVPLQHTTL